MIISTEQSSYQLSEEENQDIFENDIIPDYFPTTRPAHETFQEKDVKSIKRQEPVAVSDSEREAITIDLGLIWNKPKAVFLGGQPGSGKASLAEFHRRQFTQAGGAVVVNSDELREYHPQFESLQQSQFDKASFLVNPDTIKWQQKLIAAAADSGRNLILDGTLGGDPAPIRQTMDQLRNKGYSIQLSILAVPAILSRLGIYKRYEDQLVLKGSGRWVGMATHDRLYSEIPQTVAWLEELKAVDRIQIYGRFIGSISPLLHENWLENGEWHTHPRAADALEENRNRPWSTIEKDSYQLALQSIKWKMANREAAPEHRDGLDNQPEQIPLIYRSAQPSDVQLYFDWANDPVTRQQSFRTDLISWENHTAWFTRKIIDPNTLLLVFETQQQVPVGQVRLEQLGEEIIIGISLDSAFRGQGLAPTMLEAAVEAYHAQFPEDDLPIHAYIRPDNRASVRSFERAGFTFSHESNKFGVQSVVFTANNE